VGEYVVKGFTVLLIYFTVMGVLCSIYVFMSVLTSLGVLS
jgi:hypothetical protein